MTTTIIDAVLHEANWMPLAMLVAATTVGIRLRRVPSDARSHIVTLLGALSLFYGVMLGTMASGHLLAVTVTAARGSLQGSPWFLYSLGLALAGPAWWLAVTAGGLREADGPKANRLVGLNGWLGLGLMTLGIHNWPLAAPSALNIAYRFHRKPIVGRAIVTVTGLGYLVLFAGAVVFMASGQTFEQFQGLSD